MAYRVMVQPSGLSFIVQDDETILEAALRCGFFFPHNCRIGICGSCKGQVMEGEIDYAGREILALSQHEQDQGYALFCCAQPKTDLVIYVEDFARRHPALLSELSYEVKQCDALTPEITRILLQAPANQFIHYQAGQYIKITHRDGQLSPLSIACAPNDYSVIELHLAHPENNSVAQDILAMIAEEKKLTLRGPYGNCTSAEIYSEQPVILLARGTGFAPIKAIIEELAQFKKHPAIHLYWSATTPDELYLDKLAKRWANELSNFSYTPVLSRVHADWSGKTGLLQHIVLEDYPDLSQYRVYASAPEPIVHDVWHELARAGLRREYYFSDIFDYDASS